MAKPEILATHPLFEPARRLLNGNFEMEYWPGPGRIPRGELIAKLRDKHGLICQLSDKVDEDLLSQAPLLKLAATVSVGFDHIDLDACARHGVVATNTPGVLDETTADFAWVLIFAVARRLLEGVEMTHSGHWQGSDLAQLCGADVWGKTLGVIGPGRIGRAVGRRAAGFRMRVLYSGSARAAAQAEVESGAESVSPEYVSLERLLAESDFVTLHVPLLPTTRHLISTAQLALMKPTAFLINTARGPVVDEEALVRALDAGTIAGAALDVYENEPKIHPGLLGRKNVVLTPHMASASLETRTRMAVMAAENAVALFSGKRPPNILNPKAL